MKFIAGIVMTSFAMSAFAAGDAQRLLEKRECISCNLEGARLDGANLAEVSFWRSNMRNARLQGANLRMANLFQVNLESANLNGANLRQANLFQANLRGASTEGTRFTEAHFCRTIMPDGKLRNDDCR